MHRRPGSPRKRRRTAVLALALISTLTAVVGAPVAHAGPLVESAQGCPVDPLEQPFRPWLDPADYVLAPGGTFEHGASRWSLDGARVVSGNEPYYVHGAGETKSLALPAGATATSGTICVGLEEPTVRLFVRSSSPSLLSKLKVEVLFEDAFGNVKAAPIGQVPAFDSTAWNPYLPMAIGVNLLPLIDGKTPIQLRFSAQGSAGWQIDDVYVDPRRH